MLSLLILFWLDAATITTASAGQIGTHDVAVRTIQMSLAALQLSRWGVPWQLTSYIFPSSRTSYSKHSPCGMYVLVFQMSPLFSNFADFHSPFSS